MTSKDWPPKSPQPPLVHDAADGVSASRIGILYVKRVDREDLQCMDNMSHLHRFDQKSKNKVKCYSVRYINFLTVVRSCYSAVAEYCLLSRETLFA